MTSAKVANGYNFILTKEFIIYYFQIFRYPGIAIMIMVLAFTLLGNGLRDAFDTKATLS